jgi:hypothetical protein
MTGSAKSGGPSALMRSPHHLHGVLDMTPLVGFVGVTLVLALNRLLRRLGDRLEAVLLEHLPRDRVNLRLGDHVALLMFGHSEPRDRFPPVAGSLSNGPTGVSFRLTLENNFAHLLEGAGHASRVTRAYP